MKYKFMKEKNKLMSTSIFFYHLNFSLYIYIYIYRNMKYIFQNRSLHQVLGKHHFEFLSVFENIMCQLQHAVSISVVLQLFAKMQLFLIRHFPVFSKNVITSFFGQTSFLLSFNSSQFLYSFVTATWCHLSV